MHGQCQNGMDASERQWRGWLTVNSTQLQLVVSVGMS